MRNDSSEWRVVEEPLQIVDLNGNIQVTNVKYLKRDLDGATVSQEGFNREMKETFLMKGDFGELKFCACRWDEDTETVNDLYIVYLFWPLLVRDKVGLARSLAKDIESALLNYPLSYANDFIPVKDVLFRVDEEPNHLLHAEEIS